MFGRGLRKAASSIAFTSLTDLAAFYLGSVTQIPAVRWFCLYAGTSVVFVFLMQARAVEASARCTSAVADPMVLTRQCHR